MEYRVWQPASARSQHDQLVPVPYYWVIGHCEDRDKWLMVECNIISWNDSMTFTFLSIVHNTAVTPLSHEYAAGEGLGNGLHIITQQTISTGFNGLVGLIVSSYRNTYYVLDMHGRVGHAGQWPALRASYRKLAPRGSDHPLSFSTQHGWILEMTGRCSQHSALLGLLDSSDPKTHKIYKFTHTERSYWLWLDGPNALFSENWSAAQVDTSGGYHLYIVDTTTRTETPYSYTGPETFHRRVLTWPTYYENLVKYDVMNGQIVMITRLRDSHDNSKYRVYFVNFDHDNQTFSTHLRIAVPYGEYNCRQLVLSFSRGADKFCTTERDPVGRGRLVYYSLAVPTLRAASYQAVARQRVIFECFWRLGRLARWLRDIFWF